MGPEPPPHWEITSGYRFPYVNTGTDLHREAIDQASEYKIISSLISLYIQYGLNYCSWTTFKCFKT